jgi:hypothetical protein
MEGGEITTIVTFCTLKKQWTVAFVVLLLFGSTLPLAAPAASAESSCRKVDIPKLDSNPKSVALGETVTTTVGVNYVESLNPFTPVDLSPLTISFRWVGAAGEKIVENAPVVRTGSFYTYTQIVGDDFPTGTVTIFVIACSCSDGQGNSGPTTDMSSDDTEDLTDNSVIQIGAATQQPAQPATQDLLATYSIPIVIAIVVILAVLLLVLRRRKKKT